MTRDGTGDDEKWENLFSDQELSALGYSRSLARGLRILTCFTPETPVRGVTDIAANVDLLPQTVARYLNTLVTLGYLQKGRNHKYRLTLGITRLGLSALAAAGIREHAHRYMEELCECSSFTVSLAVLDGPEILYLDRVTSRRYPDIPSERKLCVDSRSPAHCTAMGKLLLAYCPKTEQSRHLREIKLTTETPNTITSKPTLRKALARILTDGFAVNDQESVRGTHAVAVPVRSASNEVIAALSMTAPITAISLTALIEHLKPYLLATAGKISGRMGYRR